MSNAVQKADKATTMLKKLESSFVDALPDHLQSKHFSRSLLTAFRKTPKLLDCDGASVGLSVLTAAQLGLQIGVNGQAYLLPFKKECQLIIGYVGLIDLCYRSGFVESISADVICENDEFEYKQGLEQVLTHVPKLDGNRGKPYAVYAIARIKDSKTPTFVVMNKEEVLKVKGASPSAGSSYSPWNGDFQNEMWKKTAIRRLVKLLPKSIEINSAMQFENEQEERMKEVRATVMTEAASSGVQEKIRAQKAKQATQEPTEPEITVCAAYPELTDLVKVDRKAVDKATAKAASDYPGSCAGLKTFDDINPEDQAQCSTVVAIVRGEG